MENEMRKHIDTFKNFCMNEDFRPGFVTSPAPWGSVEEARKIIIGVLLQRPDLTLQKFVELNKNKILVLRRNYVQERQHHTLLL